MEKDYFKETQKDVSLQYLGKYPSKGFNKYGRLYLPLKISNVVEQRRERLKLEGGLKFYEEKLRIPHLSIWDTPYELAKTEIKFSRSQLIFPTSLSFQKRDLYFVGMGDHFRIYTKRHFLEFKDFLHKEFIKIQEI